MQAVRLGFGRRRSGADMVQPALHVSPAILLHGQIGGVVAEVLQLLAVGLARRPIYGAELTAHLGAQLAQSFAVAAALAVAAGTGDGTVVRNLVLRPERSPQPARDGVATAIPWRSLWQRRAHAQAC